MRTHTLLAVILILAVIFLTVYNEKSSVYGGVGAQDEGVYVGIRPMFDFTGTGVTVTDDTVNNKLTVDVTAGSGAPTDATYITGSAEAGLSAELVLTAGSEIDLTPGVGTMTVSLEPDIVLDSADITTLSYNVADWTGGNITYVPLAGDIQDYIDAAAAGDTLILASGTYAITTGLTIDKELNIIGQGSSGFATIPITPGRGTMISSATDAVTAFTITSSNVRISMLSINLTGAGCYGINTGPNMTGLVLNNIDVILIGTGIQAGFTIYGSDMVMRDSTFYVESTDSGALGVYIWNDSNVTQDAICDMFSVTGTVIGAGSYAYGVVANNSNDANSVTLNISNTIVSVPNDTTPLDLGMSSISTTTSNAIINAYLCTISGADFDAYQTNSNQLNLGGSVLVNNKVSGTVTYRAAMASGLGVFGTSMSILENGATPTLYGIFDVADLTVADKTYTFPNATGEVTLLGQTIGTAEVEAGVTVDTEWDTQGEVETVWGTTLATDTELAAKPSLVGAGSNGTAAANAGDDTTAARSDHEHYTYRTLVWFYSGTLATGDPGIWIRMEEAGANGDILSAYAVLGTAGSTSSTVDILTCSQTNVDGTPSWTTIFTNKLLIDANERSTNTASPAPSLNVTSWTANDHFRINIDTAGTSAANLTVTLKIRVKDKAS